jgi:hypothetical protein
MQHDSDSSGSMPESASPVRMQEGANNAAAHDALPLVERLRHTPNWMRESYGSWKDCVLTYDRSPFEAAALLAELAALKGHDPARKVPAAQGRWITLNVPAEMHARLRAAVTPTAEPPAQGATQDEVSSGSLGASGAAWRPIETAPRDGTAILLYNAKRGGSWIGRWHPVAVSGYRFENPWGSLMLNHEYLPNRNGNARPSHWMPLPQPPSARAQEPDQDEPSADARDAVR